MLTLAGCCQNLHQVVSVCSAYITISRIVPRCSAHQASLNRPGTTLAALCSIQKHL